MRFANIIFTALPLFAGVFSAPAPAPAPAPGILGGAGGFSTGKTDVDVLGVVSQLRADIVAAGFITPASSQVDVEACLGAVVKAFDTCGNKLGVNLDLSLNVGLALGGNWWDSHCTTKACSNSVAAIVADVVVKVDAIVKGIDAKLCKTATILDLLLKISTCLCNFLSCLDKVFVGLVLTVKALLVGYSCKPSYLLASVIALLHL